MTPTADLMKLVDKLFAEARELEKGDDYSRGAAAARETVAFRLQAALSSTGEARVGEEELLRYGFPTGKEVRPVECADGYWTPWHIAQAALATPAQPKASEGKAGGEDVKGQWFCDGPTGHFYTNDFNAACVAVQAIDPEGNDWTITNLAATLTAPGDK